MAADRPGSRRSGNQARATARTTGLTLVELALVLGVLGVLAGAGAWLVRPGGAAQAAQGARAFLLWARLEAIWTGRAVAVVPARSPALSARSAEGDDVASACGGPELRSFELSRYGGVRVVDALRSGIVWLPRGGARSCLGGGVISDTMVLADGRRRLRVIVSSLGRVRVEDEP